MRQTRSCNVLCLSTRYNALRQCCCCYGAGASRSRILQVDKVRLDASSDSLLLQGDPDLAFFEEATERYESYEFLIMTWEPGSPLLSESSLAGLAAMVADLEQVSGVRSVTSALDVPLLESPPISLTDLSDLDSIPSFEIRMSTAHLRFANLPRASSIKISS